MIPSAIRAVNASPANHNRSSAECCTSLSGSQAARSSFFGDSSSQCNLLGRLNYEFRKHPSDGPRGLDEIEFRYPAVSSVLSLKDAKKSLNPREKVPPVFPVNLNSCLRGWLSHLFPDGTNVEGKAKQMPTEVEPQFGGFEALAADECGTGKSLGPLHGYIIQSFHGSGYSPISLTEVVEDSITARGLAEVAIIDLVSAIPSIDALQTLPYFDMLHKNLVQAPRIIGRYPQEAPLSGAMMLPSSDTKRVQVVTSEDFGSADALASWLSVRLPSGVEQWGIEPGTKRVLNLWMELKEGEIVLEDVHPPRRTVHVASVKIRNKAGFMLVEAHQEMADGSIRHRNRPLSEKMRPGENVEEACLRGISEELGSQLGAKNRVRIVGGSYRQKQEERESRSYPGLLTLYVIHSVDAIVEDLPEAGFYTVEDEAACHSSLNTVVIPCPEPEAFYKGIAVGVKKHYWRWVTQAS